MGYNRIYGKMKNLILNYMIIQHLIGYPLSQAVCRLGSDRYPNDYINLDYSRNNFHEAYYQIENFFLKTF